MCELTIDEYKRSKAPFWWRLCRRSRRLNEIDRWARRKLAEAVPIWLAVLFLAFCMLVAQSVTMMGGVR